MFCNLKYAILPAFFALLVSVQPASAQESKESFVSFRSSEVNVRTGPGYRYPIEYVYKRRHLPVKIVDSFDHWRKVEDYEGDSGWVHRNLLNDRQSVITRKSGVLLKKNPAADSPSVAEMERDVVGVVEECEFDWCHIEVEGYEGWVNKSDVWGVEP